MSRLGNITIIHIGNDINKDKFLSERGELQKSLSMVNTIIICVSMCQLVYIIVSFLCNYG